MKEEIRRAQTPRVAAAKRRSLIMEAAASAFAEYGFDTTSMDEIARRANVTKPVLYQHFDSKRALYLALLSQVGTELTEQIAVATEDVPEPHSRLAMGISAYYKFVHDQHFAFSLLFQSRPPGDEEITSLISGVRDAIALLVTTRLTGIDDRTERQLVASGLIGLVEGTAASYLRSSEARTDFEKPFRNSAALVWAEHTTDLLWHGLRSPRAPLTPSTPQRQA